MALFKKYQIRFADGVIKKFKFVEFDANSKFFRLKRRKKNTEKDVVIPATAVLGRGSLFALKPKYTYCCHTYTSRGDQIRTGSDEITKLVMENQELERQVSFLGNVINTTRYDISEMQKMRKEWTDEEAAKLKKLIESTTVPARARTVIPAQYPDYYPPMPTEGGGMKEEEEE